MRISRVWVALAAVTGLVVASASAAEAVTRTGAVRTTAVFNVRDYGATGNGSSNDSGAIDRAITAANAAGGGTVQFTAGTYRSANTIHMKSNVTLQLDAGSVIRGTGGAYDPPESNQWDQYQDYGHSHFHNAMIYGDRLTNIGFVGSGMIDGGGALITGNPKSAQADKIISLTRCDGLTVSGITLREGGHFAMLINGCTNVVSDRLRIDTAMDRDGWNVISTTNVKITNAYITANDDALVFKSDYALGQKLPNGNVTVTDTRLGAVCCNALMFGSETCGDFTGYHFERISINGSNKSGLGMVSMDGTVISDVHYKDITMSNVRSPIMQKIGTRRRCGNSPGIGRIHDITYENVTGTGQPSANFSPTIWGAGAANQVSDVTFTNVNLTVPGGSGTVGTGVPSNNATDYNPGAIGTRPAYGWYVHYANNIRWINSSVQFVSNDNRPAVIANNAAALTFDHFTAERGSGSPTDLLFQTVAGYCVRDSANTTGGALRISQTGSTASCPDPGNDFSLAVTPASRSVEPGGTATYTVDTRAVAGSPGDVTLAAGGLPAGATATFSPNPVPAGASSTLTVATSASTPSGTSNLTVSGTAGTVSHSAGAGLVVGGGGGGPLTVSGLTVADAGNAADWSVQSDLRTGVAQYGDRTITLTAVPAALTGARWIRTANDSKGATADPLASFTISAPATVAVAVDTRVGKRSWMDGSWVDSGTQIVNNEGTAKRFQVFTKTFPAGSVALGPNGSTGSSMYLVAVY